MKSAGGKSWYKVFDGYFKTSLIIKDEKNQGKTDLTNFCII